MTTDNHKVGLPEKPLRISVFAAADGLDGDPYIELSRDSSTGHHLTVEEARAYAGAIIETCEELDPPSDAEVLRGAVGTALAVADAHGGHDRSPRAIEAMKRGQRRES